MHDHNGNICALINESWCQLSLADKSRNDLQQMKTEIANMSDKLDTLLTQRETEDEGQFKTKIDTELSWSSERNIFTKKEVNDFIQSLFYTQLWVGLLNWVWKCCLGEVLRLELWPYINPNIGLYIKAHYLSLTPSASVRYGGLSLLVSFTCYVTL